MMTHTEMIQSDNSSAEKKNIEFLSISLFKFYLFIYKKEHL